MYNDGKRSATVWNHQPVSMGIDTSKNPTILDDGGVSHLALGGGELHDFSTARGSATDSAHYKDTGGIHHPLTPRSEAAVKTRTQNYLDWKKKPLVMGLAGYSN